MHAKHENRDLKAQLESKKIRRRSNPAEGFRGARE